jgi:hypothetical protein
MGAEGRLAFVIALVFRGALGANYWIYDGGVRRQNDTTITNSTYAPSIGGRLVGGTGVILGDVGGGLHAEAAVDVGPTTGVHRPICIYGNGGPVANCSTR